MKPSPYIHIAFPKQSGGMIVSFLVMLAVLTTSCAARAQGVTTTLTPTTFSTDEPATLTVTIEGGRQHDEPVKLPEIDGLAFHYRGQSQQYQIYNGAFSSSVAYTYLVQGLKPGTYTVPAIEVMIDGKKMASQPLTCTVTATNGAPPGQQHSPSGQPGKTAPSLAFLRLTLDHDTAFEGERVAAEINAYFKSGIKVNLNSEPTLKSDGALLEILERNPLRHEEQIDGVKYVVLTWPAALTGIKEGEQKLNMELDATIDVPSHQRRLPSGFGGSLLDDDLFDNFFQGYERRQLKVVTGTPLLCTVKKLPRAGKPKGFTGAVGSFTMDLSATPTKLDLGEPLTLTMTVKGTGNFDSVHAPEITDLNGLKTYTPRESFTHGADHLQGKKEFEQAVIVSDPVITRIPPVSFSYFDPLTQRYRTLFSDPIELTVNNPQSSRVGRSTPELASAPAGTHAEGASTDRISLAPVKPEQGSPVQKIEPLFLAPWFILTCSGCVLLIIFAVAYRIHNSSTSRQVARRRSKNIRDKRRDALEALRNIGSEQTRDELFRLRYVLREFLGELWRVRPDSLTSGDIRKKLGEQSALTELFIAADQADYGGMASVELEREDLRQRLINETGALS